MKAPDYLKDAAAIMEERGKQYDSEAGERSMEQTVTAFEAITGKCLTEAEGWLFMALLKMVRDNKRVVAHEDSCLDLIAYTALYAEARLP